MTDSKEDYSIDLQRIIEDLCAGRPIRQPTTTARYHYNKAVARHAALSAHGKNQKTTTNARKTPRFAGIS